MEFSIRSEQPSDYIGIDEVNRLAFGQENEGSLIRRIRQAPTYDPSLSLVAIRDEEVIGHVLFSSIQIETRQTNVPALALAPLTVTPQFQNRGVGSALTRDGLAACRRAEHRLVIVLGHAEYYPRFGFVPAGPYGFKCPFPVSDEVFMVLELSPGSLEGVSGMVRYPHPFEGV